MDLQGVLLGITHMRYDEHILRPFNQREGRVFFIEDSNIVEPNEGYPPTL